MVGNVAPREMRTCSTRSRAGRLVEAERLHKQLRRCCAALFLESNPGPVKYLLADMGLIANELRLPLVPVEPPTALAVREAARIAGVVLKDTVGAAR